MAAPKPNKENTFKWNPGTIQIPASKMEDVAVKDLLEGINKKMNKLRVLLGQSLDRRKWDQKIEAAWWKNFVDARGNLLQNGKQYELRGALLLISFEKCNLVCAPKEKAVKVTKISEGQAILTCLKSSPSFVGSERGPDSNMENGVTRDGRTSKINTLLYFKKEVVPW